MSTESWGVLKPEDRRVIAIITHENGRQVSWRCETAADAVRCWLREMTAPQNVGNPAVAVEWVFSERGGPDEGIVIGAFRRPDAPRSEAWAQVVEMPAPKEEAAR